MISIAILSLLTAFLHLTQAHLVLTYPGWRGDTLHTNGTLPEYDPNALVVNEYENGTRTFPYGMQWTYPCGGLPQSTNRTKWPVDGGAVAFQPGWFTGHKQAQLYVNFGIQEEGMLAPPNMSHNVISHIGITGPSDEPYPNLGICFPQVPMPAGIDFKVGDFVTLQVVMSAQHGAALYGCVDLVLADNTDPDIEPVDSNNCGNASQIGLTTLFASSSLTSGAQPLLTRSSGLALLTGAIVASAFTAFI